MLNIMYIR